MRNVKKITADYDCNKNQNIGNIFASPVRAFNCVSTLTTIGKNQRSEFLKIYFEVFFSKSYALILGHLTATIS